MAILWHILMAVWLAGLLYGVWWAWPLFERMTLTADLLMALVWLVTGGVAWFFALNLGRQRYWRR